MNNIVCTGCHQHPAIYYLDSDESKPVEDMSFLCRNCGHIAMTTWIMAIMVWTNNGLHQTTGRRIYDMTTRKGRNKAARQLRRCGGNIVGDKN